MGRNPHPLHTRTQPQHNPQVLRTELLSIAREPARIPEYVGRHKLCVTLYHVKQWLNAVKRQWDTYMPPDDAEVVGQLI